MRAIYVGRQWCQECHPDHPTRPCWRLGLINLCRDHFTAATGSPPPEPRTADNIDHSHECGCIACAPSKFDESDKG